MVSSWLDKGLEHVWLPYTQMKQLPELLPVASAKGVTLTLEDGRTLIDGIASWWSVCHGYSHPHIIAAVEEQLHKLPHVMFAGLAHEPAYRLAERLAHISPEGLSKVFFSDSGSTAVEVAMKMAIQYWRNQGEKHRCKFISFSQGYHGDTMGGMSLCDPNSGMHQIFSGALPKQYVVDIPRDEYAFSELDDLLDAVKQNVAGVIIEPLVQGAGGMQFHSADKLAELYRITKKHGLLFLADEVATGFGRTGLMFASLEADITPDIMMVGKALTGGTMTLAATLATDEVYNVFIGDSLELALMHGPTFMANPLACAAANASLDLFEQENRLEQVDAIEIQLFAALDPLKQLDQVKDVRVKGAIGVVEFHECDWNKICYLRKALVKQGVWLRPFSNVIYIMPAFTITPEELEILTNAVSVVVAESC